MTHLQQNVLNAWTCCGTTAAYLVMLGAPGGACCCCCCCCCCWLAQGLEETQCQLGWQVGVDILMLRNNQSAMVSDSQ